MQIFGQRASRSRLNPRPTRAKLGNALAKSNAAATALARELQAERAEKRRIAEDLEAAKAPLHVKLLSRVKSLFRRKVG